MLILDVSAKCADGSIILHEGRPQDLQTIPRRPVDGEPCECEQEAAESVVTAECTKCSRFRKKSRMSTEWRAATRRTRKGTRLTRAPERFECVGYAFRLSKQTTRVPRYIDGIEKPRERYGQAHMPSRKRSSEAGETLPEIRRDGRHHKL